MDAGVPIRNTVAGISVGRFSDDNDTKELFVTDIIGEERLVRLRHRAF
jgi:polyribonucleotide nucleotidyltransferase